jgi:hypothetical protein
MPTGPLARPLPLLVAQFGWASALSSLTDRGIEVREVDYDVLAVDDVGDRREGEGGEGGRREVEHMGDVGFWTAVAQHPKTLPADVMAMLALLARVSCCKCLYRI